MNDDDTIFARFERLKARAAARGVDWADEFHGLDLLQTMVLLAERLGVASDYDPDDILDLGVPLHKILGEGS